LFPSDVTDLVLVSRFSRIGRERLGLPVDPGAVIDPGTSPFLQGAYLSDRKPKNAGPIVTWLTRMSITGLALATIGVIMLIFRGAFFAVGWFGITVQILAALLMVWARLTFGRRSFHAAAGPTEGGLVTSGPYRILRHPIYSSVMYAVWAGGISHWSLVHLALMAIVTLGLALRIISEERLVCERYPEYSEYAARTKRIIPFVF
jgi:protein-S-isoprenylcysteine O-methyltransferase Ste14